MPIEKPTCKDCEYFVVYDKDHGRCHLNPPQPTYDGNFRFPLVRNNDWCGHGIESEEYKAKKME